MPVKLNRTLPLARKAMLGAMAGISVLSLGLAQANAEAVLSQVSGEVMVNAGNGFKTAGAATKLRLGDQVLVSPGGAAHVTLENGCAIPVSPGDIVTIAEEMACDMPGAKGNGFAVHSQAAIGAGAGVGSAGAGAGVGAAGAGAGVAGAGAGVAGAAGGAIVAGGVGATAAVVAAGVGVAAAVGVAVTGSQGGTKDDKPTSP